MPELNRKVYLRSLTEIDVSNKPKGAIDILYALDTGAVLEWNRDLIKRWVDNGNDVDAYQAMYTGPKTVARFIRRVITDSEWASLAIGNAKMENGVMVPLDGTIEVR